MQIHKWIKELEKNKKQAEALYKPGNTVVVAGPGSGKTRVLTTKIAKLLLEEVWSPQGIACLTFTRMMAKEIEQRLYRLGIQDRPNIFVGTVHSFCLSHIVSPYAKLFGMKLPDPIRIAPKQVADNTLEKAIRTYVKGIDERTAKKQFNILRQLRADIPFQNWVDSKNYAKAIANYQKSLMESGYLDFDLIIKIGLRLIISQPLVRNSLHAKFPWIAVDEYQDLGYPLYRIVTEMINKTPTKLIAIGDPNQSIFDFAGTNPKYLLELSAREDMQPIVTLEKNYRSTQEIIDISDAILSKKTGTFSEHSGGQCTMIKCDNFEAQIEKAIEITKRLNSEGVDLNEIAILHRYRDTQSGNDLNHIANYLSHRNIEYVLDKHQYYDRAMGIIKWLEDLAFWSLSGWKSSQANRYTFDDLLNFWLDFGASETLSYNKEENLARTYFASILWDTKDPNELLSSWLSRIYDNLSLKIFLEKYSELNPDEVNEFNKLIELTKSGCALANLTIRKFSNLDPSVQLTTVHSSKGNEFNSVVIVGAEQFGVTENQKRLMYVGATRAKTNLYLLYTKIGHKSPKYIEDIRRESINKNWGFINFLE